MEVYQVEKKEIDHCRLSKVNVNMDIVYWDNGANIAA